jgi:hypothetical protein
MEPWVKPGLAFYFDKCNTVRTPSLLPLDLDVSAMDTTMDGGDRRHAPRTTLHGKNRMGELIFDLRQTKESHG